MPCRITPQGERMFRFAREEEQRRREAHERRRHHDQREAQRLNAFEREWNSFKSGVSSVQREQMRRAFFQHHDNVFRELESYFNTSAARARTGGNLYRTVRRQSPLRSRLQPKARGSSSIALAVIGISRALLGYN